jgi:proteasome accessory factor C
VTNADYLARPLRLTPTEATAIIVALRALRNGARDETREVVDRALAKLEAAAAEGSAALQIDPGEDPVGSTDLIELATRLQGAVDRAVQVDITYFVPSRDEESERTVDPRGIVTANGFTYLDAWCHSADGLFARADDTTLVTLRIGREARWIVEYYPVEAVRPRRGGVLEVDLLIADERWLQRLLLRLAPHAEVLRPPEYAAAHTTAARAALSLYE